MREQVTKRRSDVLMGPQSREGRTSSKLLQEVNITLPMQYTENFSALKIENCIRKILIILMCLLKTLIVGTH